MTNPPSRRELLPLEESLQEAWPPQDWGNVTVMVCVSGGPDSVALIRAMHHLADLHCRSLRGTLQVLHFDHRWRSAESAADVEFVAGLCDQLGLSCHLGQAEAAAVARDEATARRQRYAFFRRAAEENGARYVVTGHTADDQIETVLHRIIRGTGLGGLAGIRRCRALGEATTVIRPMLHVSRTEITAYLRALQQPFREDSTNNQRRFTRNRLRHDLLPLLAEQYNPAIGDSLLKLSTLARESQELIDSEVARHVPVCVVKREQNYVILDHAKLRELPDFLRRELISTVWRQQAWPEQAMGYADWSRLAHLAIADSGTLHLPGKVVAEATATQLRLRRDSG